MWNRDSVVWWIGIVASVVVGLATLSDPAAYGVPPDWVPYLRLGALIVGIVSGKLATSPLPGAQDGSKVDLTKVGPLLLVAAVLAASSTSGCALRGSARHKAVVTAIAVSDSLIAVSDVERTLAASPVSGITPEQHRAFQAKMVPLLTAARQADQALLDWPGGSTPMPESLKLVVRDINDLTATVIAALPDGPSKAAIQSKLLIVQNLIAMFLVRQ